MAEVSNAAKWRLFTIVGVLSLIADQATKIWARGSLPTLGKSIDGGACVPPSPADWLPDASHHVHCYGDTVNVIKGFWTWRLSMNPGSAFGLFGSLAVGRVLLSIVGIAAVIGMLSLAVLSTVQSPNVTASATVLLHGILEPAFIAAALLLLRPTRRDLMLVLTALAISVAIGSLLNMVQMIPTMKTLAGLQMNRLLFSRITYFNIGLYGEMLAMTTPILLALLLAHWNGYLRLHRVVVAVLLVAVPIDLASLFLTFTKSAYLGAIAGCLVLLLLFVHSWQRRVSISLAVVLLSAVVIPWPALVLQVAPPLNEAYRSAMVPIIGENRFDSWNPSTGAGKGSIVERFYATRAGLEMAIDHPFLGVSLDQFGIEYADHYKPPQATLELDWAHSMLPEVAAELGFPALILDLIIYGAAILALWRVYRAPPDPLARLMAAALLAMMVSWQMVGTAFAGDMYRPWRNMASDYVTMMVLVAVAFTLYRLSRGGQSREAPVPARP